MCRRLLLCSLGGLLAGPLAAQTPYAHGYVRTLAAPALGAGTPRVVALADGSAAVFVGDSLAVVRLLPCGRATWARRYHFAGLTVLPGQHYCTALADGGLAFVTRAQRGTETAPLVVRLDATGAVRWSRLVSAPDYTWNPYTLGETATGNLVLFANLTETSTNAVFNTLVQLSPGGALRWARRYDQGGIWGGALCTRDGGVLARTGYRFIKTDSVGAVQWTSSVLPSGGDSYYAPVEVRGGYAFTFSLNGGSDVAFAALDSVGRVRTAVRLPGVPKRFAALRSQYGRPIALVNPDSAGVTYPRMHVLGKLNRPPFGADSARLPYPRPGFSFDLTPDHRAIVVGRVADGTPTALFILSAGNGWSSNFGFDCIPYAGGNDFPAVALTQTFITTTALPFAPVPTDYAARVTAFTVRQTTIIGRSAICVPAPAALDLGPDTVICDAPDTLRLRNRRPFVFTEPLFDEYLWSTGATTPAITVTAAGTYWLRAITNCGLDTLTDTLRVTQRVVPAPVGQRDTVRCSDEAVWLDARVAGAASYRWFDGSTAPRYLAPDTGRYTVTVRLGGCARQIEFRVTECERLLMPNIFTPGAPDGVNDRFVPIEQRGIASASLEVYTRWGQPVFTTDDLRRGWDGTAGGHACAAGTYFWLVRYRPVRGPQRMVKGWVEVGGGIK